jgi:DnaB-like helicase C terminal domain
MNPDVTHLIDFLLVGMTRTDPLGNPSTEMVHAWCPLCEEEQALRVATSDGRWDCAKCGKGGAFSALAEVVGYVPGAQRVTTYGNAVMEAAKGKRAIKSKSHGLTMGKVLAERDALLDDAGIAVHEVRRFLGARGIIDAAHFKIGFTTVTVRGEEQVALSIPYIERGEVVMARVRNTLDGEGKFYTRSKGADAFLYNIDAVRGCKRVVLTRGELNAICISQAGMRAVAAVPEVKAIPTEWTEALATATEIVLWVPPSDLSSDNTQALIRALGAWRIKVASPAEALVRRASEALGRPALDVNDFVMAGPVCGVMGSDIRGIVRSAVQLGNDKVVSADHYADVMLSLIDRAETLKGIPWGLDCLDNTIGGVRWGEVTLGIGRVKQGKTTFWKDRICWLSERGCPTLELPMEMGPIPAHQKTFQRQIGVPISSLKSEKEKSRARGEVSVMHKHPAYTFDHHGPVDIPMALAAMRDAIHRHGVKVIMIDGYDYLEPEDRGKDFPEQLKQTMLTLRSFAITEQVHIILMMHVQSSVVANVVPTMDAIKGGSAAKQIADNCVSIWRDVENAGDETMRELKLKTSSGNSIEVVMNGNQVLIDVSMVRADGCSTGRDVVDFRARDVRYFNKKKVTDDGPAQSGGVVEGRTLDTEDFFDDVDPN